MNSKNKKNLLGLCLIVGITGCVTTNQNAGMMDPYDPRNNIPLLQAATRTSGVNVPQIEALSGAQKKQGSGLVFTNGGSVNSSTQRLRDLKALRDEGVLTQKEYEVKKAEILKSM